MNWLQQKNYWNLAQLQQHISDTYRIKFKSRQSYYSDGNSTLSSLMDIPGVITALLPMAFPEGSPMHPAYGAGHATVAGACVTILKAFFDTSAVLAQTSAGAITFKRQGSGDTPIAFQSPDLPGPGAGEGYLPEILSHIPLDSF